MSTRVLRTHSMTTRSVEQHHNDRAAVGYQLTVDAMQNEIRNICRPDLAAFRECALAELRAKSHVPSTIDCFETYRAADAIYVEAQTQTDEKYPSVFRAMETTLETLHGMDNMYRVHCNEPREMGSIRGMHLNQWQLWFDTVLDEIQSDVHDEVYTI